MSRVIPSVGARQSEPELVIGGDTDTNANQAIAFATDHLASDYGHPAIGQQWICAEQ